MSGANADCHVSTKWEDTGGKDGSECDANVLLGSPNTNGDSLQELIEKELALRSSAVTNGVDRPKSLLICDLNDDDGDEDDNDDNDDTKDTSKQVNAFDIFDAVSPVNGCQRSGSFKLTRGVPVTEVDDFDVLYNEVSSDELVSNGHVTLTGLLSPELEMSIASSLSDDKSEGKVDIEVGNNESTQTPTKFVRIDSIGTQSLSFTDETESSLDSVRVACIISTNKNVDFVQPFSDLAANATNDDFVPVSEVDIVVDEQENINSITDDKSTVSMTSMIDVRKVVEDMEDPRHITDDNDLITNALESGNRRQNNDNDAAVNVAADDAVNNVAQQCHYEVQNIIVADDCSIAESKCNMSSCPESADRIAHCNGDVTDDARAVLVLDKDSTYNEIITGDQNDFDNMFEKGFERWSTEASNVAMIAATCEKSINKKSRCEQMEECSYDLTMSGDVVSESNTEEKKSVKKKKSTSEESVATAKTRKTKKTKKYEEKENISVNNELKQNGLDDPNFHQIVDDSDELSNVCVRDLKIMYCNEASKTTSSAKLSPYEEPIPASVPIKELKSVSMSDLSFVGGNQSRSVWEKKRVKDLRMHETDFLSLGERTLVRSMAVKYEALKHNNETALNFKNKRSGFGKFDQLTKKSVMHVRSSDAAKAPQQFSQNDASQDSGNRCKACNKNVFAMEQIKAERHVWHKNCFRCKTCNKQLTVDIYSSHEGELFCKPHFRDLFKPKTVIEDEQPTKLKKPELIIRENEPMELPPDVVRASDKSDLGLEELSSLNVKSRFQVFEKPQIEETTDKSPVSVKRSPSILSKLAKFQAKGMDVGVSSDIFNGIDYEESSSSEDEEAAPDDNITRSTVVKEKPIAFNKMSDVKKNWENGQAARKEERLEQRREELQNIRSRIFQGKQNKMKEAYENAVAESERMNVKKDVEIRSEKARSIKEKFEKGEILLSDESDTEQDKKMNTHKDDMDVFEAGISKQSRSIFQQMDAVIKTQSRNSVVSSPTPAMQNGHKSSKEVMNRQLSTDVVRASDPVEEVTVPTSDISSKFKFFETYKAPEVKRKAFRITPPREGQQPKSDSPERDVPKNPDVVRCDEQINDENEVLKKSNTTSKMLSIFRQMEVGQDNVPDGPRPLKKFTPPPQSHHNSESESDEESERSDESHSADEIVRASDKTEDEYLIIAQKAAKAKALKEKFEKWEPERQLSSNAINLLETDQTNLDTTKSIRARFESMKAEQPADKPRPKVNRFVEKSLPGFCDRCYKTVYPLEKVEAGDKVFHRNCFKCSRCHGILRMETFTMNNGHLYCVAHFKQLFITKGNYDEGFGAHQHKAKWAVHTGLPVANGIH